MSQNPPHQRKSVRLEDVAKMVDISTGTASMALAGSTRVSAATRRRVIEACQTLGYRTPRSQRRQATGRQMCVGLATIGEEYTHPVNADLLHHLAAQARQRGVRLEVTSVSTAEHADVAKRLMEFARPCDALLVTGTLTAGLLRTLAAAELHFAALATPEPDDQHPTLPSGVMIVGDDRMQGQVATQRLMARGHRRIAFVAETLRPQRSHHRWFEGYCLAHVAADLPIDKSLVGVIDVDHARLRETVKRFASSKARPTAAVVTDVAAVNPLLRELHEAGVRIEQPDMIAWGNPTVAKLYRLQAQPMIGIDAQRWADAAMRYALSSAETRFQAGSTVYVAYEMWNLPDQEKHV